MIARVYDKNPADGTAQLLDSYDMGYVVMIDKNVSYLEVARYLPVKGIHIHIAKQEMLRTGAALYTVEDLIVSTVNLLSDSKSFVNALRAGDFLQAGLDDGARASCCPR